MAMFSAQGVTYQKACELIKQLRVFGISSNITGGGVAIHCEPNQVNKAQAICKEIGASFSAGYTSHQQDVMMRSQDGYDHLKQVTNDAIAIIKEWE